MPLTVAVQLFNKLEQGQYVLAASPGRPPDFLTGALVAVTPVAGESSPFAPATPIRAVGPSGKTSFIVPQGTAYVDLNLILQPKGVAAPLVHIEQRLRLDPGGTCVGIAHPVKDHWTENNHLHPRLSLAAGAPASSYQVRVDLTFLDMTLHLRALRHGGLATFESAPGNWVDPPLTQYQVEMRVLEYTAGTPACWVVLVPKIRWGQGTAVDIGTLLFCRPAMKGAHKTAEDVDLGPVLRYLVDPPKDHPWFVIPNPRAPIINAFVPYPNCGFTRQLHDLAFSDTSKPILFVLPVPSGDSFGAVLTPEVERLIGAIPMTLWADRQTFSGASKVQSQRLGVAGFSYGGKVAIMLSDLLKSRLHELYLFDPPKFPAYRTSLEAWVQAESGRRLCLVAGHEQSHMIKFRDDMKGKLKNGNSLELMEDDPKFWADGSSLYVAASVSPEPGDFLTKAGDTPAPDAVSAFSGVFVVKTGKPTPPVRLQGVRKDGTTIGEVEVPVSEAEVATAVRFFVGRPDIFVGPFTQVKNTADDGRWRQLIKAIPERVDGVRHQWTVVGGRGALDRGKGFKGYLYLCLEKSSL